MIVSLLQKLFSRQPEVEVLPQPTEMCPVVEEHMVQAEGVGDAVGQ
ncbi:hypothetical protein KC906_02055 [Candidatus Kaiserbacteria bacterium]|nr:hypothetical protein [Candidatus Kaiserbacteria bacterium]